MRILILSANTGGGHNAAAYAIQEELKSRGIESDIEDCLRFISPKTSSFISWGHSYVYKHLPQVFGRVYQSEEKHSSKFISDCLSLGASKYHAYIAENDYQAVVSVHVFSSTLITREQRRYGKSVPHYFVSTDYTCSPGVGEIDADAWYIPDEGLREEFVRCGVPNERIFATGIPVCRAFYQRTLDKAQARELLGLPKDGRVALLCCGSIGCGHLNRIVPQFERQLPRDVTMVIVCGNNLKLYKQLTRSSGEKTVVLSFTDKMAQYMMAADVCISKPGGLSTTEMLAVGVPAVLVLLVPGCETRNMDFIAGKGIYRGTYNWEEAMSCVLDLLNQPNALDGIRIKAEEYHGGYGAQNITSYMIDELERNTHK